jgi:hypothetical protein
MTCAALHPATTVLFFALLCKVIKHSGGAFMGDTIIRSERVFAVLCNTVPATASF